MISCRILCFFWVCVLLIPLPSQARQITDELGRRVRIPEKVQRIVCLAPSLAECVFAIGQGHRLVGVTTYSDYPPKVQDLPSVGSYVNLNVERIVSLQPDLCLATKDGNPYAVIAQLQDLGIAVYALDPRDLQAVMHTLLDLGDVLGARQKAKDVVHRMQTELERISEVVSRVEHRPRVFFQIGISPIVSVGRSTFIHQLIVLAGGENVAAGPAPYPRFSLEDVLVKDPEIILINSMTKDARLVQETMDTWHKFPQIQAVASGRIHAVDAGLFNRPTPRLTQALRILCRLFHPEAGQGGS